MKRLITNTIQYSIALAAFALCINETYAQSICATPVVGCPNTNLSNYGFNSNDTAATIEYDNMTSAFHATIVRNGDGTFSTWGAQSGPAGDNAGSNLSPKVINSTNYTGLKGTPLKAGVGSTTTSHQFILLTTYGLFAWGTEGTVIDNAHTSSTAFQRLGAGTFSNADSTGLPNGIQPGDVKMLFVTYQTIAITTCGGDVWVLSQQDRLRGNGNSGNATTWYRVRKSSGASDWLTDIVVCRGSYRGLFALDGSGNIWTWGYSVYLGNNTAANNLNYATSMTKPAGTIKMIGSTSSTNKISYYVLMTNGKLYALGNNDYRQLGDFTTTERRGWVQCQYSNTPTYMNNIKWISPNEHGVYSSSNAMSVNALNANKKIYAWGNSSTSMIGRGTSSYDPDQPNGLSASGDSMLTVETGAHTSMVNKQCSSTFGYVGHRINGSMGNGSSVSATESSYTFASAPVDICGAPSKPTASAKPKINFGGSGLCYESDFIVTSVRRASYSFIQQTPSGIATLDSVHFDTFLIKFKEPGYIKLESSLPNVCGVVKDTFETAVLKCKFTNPDYNIGLINTTVSGTIATNDNISYSATPYNTSPTLIHKPSGSTPNISLSANGSYTFSADKAGTYIYVDSICDPGQVSNCEVEYLTIYLSDPTTLNNPPAAATDIVATKKNTAVAIKTLDNDYAGATGRSLVPSSVSITSSFTASFASDTGSFSINSSTGVVTFTPVSTFVGDFTYFYKVCNDASPTALCDTGIQKITVNGLGIQNTTLGVDDMKKGGKNKPVSGNVINNDIDLEGNTQSATPQNINVPGVGNFTLSSNGNYTFTPFIGFQGFTGFDYEVCDNGTPVACEKATIYIMIDNEITEPDMQATTVNKSINGDVSTNDPLPAGYLYISGGGLAGNPLGGSFSINPDGTYTFSGSNVGTYRYKVNACTPAPNAVCMEELLEINVSDPKVNSNDPITNPDMVIMYGHDSNPATVTINVRANDNISNIYGKLGALGTLANPTISVSAKNSQSLSVNGSGNIEYRPKNGFYGQDTFYYEVCEALTVLCKEEMVVITVNAPSTPVATVASDDYGFTFTATTVNVSAANGLLANDFSNSGGSWNVTPQAINNPSIGNLTINSDGSYSFVPASAFLGTAVFPYHVCKGSACTEATLYIQVFDLNLLPIELIRFQPIGFDSYVDIYWTTTAEQNNSYFTIERSYNKESWSHVGDVQGAGTSFQENNYQLTDYTKPEPLVYYKISQTDFDGIRSDLRIAKLQMGTDLVGEVMLFPNPCYQELNLSGMASRKLGYEIYNAFGQQVMKSEGGLGNELKIDVSGLPQGTYYIRVTDKGVLKVKSAFIKLD